MSIAFTPPLQPILRHPAAPPPARPFWPRSIGNFCQPYPSDMAIDARSDSEIRNQLIVLSKFIFGTRHAFILAADKDPSQKCREGRCHGNTDIYRLVATDGSVATDGCGGEQYRERYDSRLQGRGNDLVGVQDQGRAAGQAVLRAGF